MSLRESTVSQTLRPPHAHRYRECCGSPPFIWPRAAIGLGKPCFPAAAIHLQHVCGAENGQKRHSRRASARGITRKWTKTRYAASCSTWAGPKMRKNGTRGVLQHVGGAENAEKRHSRRAPARGRGRKCVKSALAGCCSGGGGLTLGWGGSYCGASGRMRRAPM